MTGLCPPADPPTEHQGDLNPRYSVCMLSPYKTRDLYYAAYLMVAAVPFKGVERVPETYVDRHGKTRTREKVTFLFEDQGSMMKPLRAEYFKDQGEVRALSYAQAIKQLKEIIFRRDRER